MEKKFINIKHSHTADQRTVMEQIQKDGVCPFCMDHFRKYHKRPILREGNHWVLTENQWPYDGTRVHLLLVAKTHITSPEKMSPEMTLELWDHFRWAIAEFKIKGGALFMRFGNTRFTGGSVSHLHAQILTKDSAAENPIIVRLG
jgi:diadenosine tetraphosphate (Ap4A) HIT family hydrolase